MLPRNKYTAIRPLPNSDKPKSKEDAQRPEFKLCKFATDANESAKALREAAEFYKVDVAAITVKVKQEFAAKDKAKATKKAAPKPPAKPPARAEKKAKAA